ncbi:MAG: hypothetical protein IJZ57_10230 [Clostridia bacterium]|nr:hypothetical protein [Clostridia bacterium]
MKKFLAVVLALVMTLAMGTAAFAYVEVAPGQIYLGPADAEYLANPGDEVTLTFRYAGSPLETDGYPTDGYAIVTFFGIIGDVNYNTITGADLTQEAKDAGCSFIVNENSMYHSFYEVESATAVASIMMPVELLSSDFNLFTITTKVADDWVVVDYVAETPIDIIGYAGDYAFAPSIIITDEEAAAITAGEMMADEVAEPVYINGIITETNTIINAMPYQPTWSECLEEQLKGLVSGFIDVLIIVFNLLKGELAPADWFIPGEHDVVDLSFITDGIAKIAGMIIGG